MTITARTTGLDFWTALVTANPAAAEWGGARLHPQMRQGVIDAVDTLIIDHGYTMALDIMATSPDTLRASINRSWPHGHALPGHIDIPNLTRLLRPITEPVSPHLVGITEDAQQEEWKRLWAFASYPLGVPESVTEDHPVDTWIASLRTANLQSGERVLPTNMAEVVDRLLVPRKHRAYLLLAERARRGHAAPGTQWSVGVMWTSQYDLREPRVERSPEGGVYFDPSVSVVTVTNRPRSSGNIEVRRVNGDGGENTQWVSPLCLLAPFGVDDEDTEDSGPEPQAVDVSEVDDLRRRLANAEAAHRNDLDIIAREFWREAHERDWCGEAESVINRINGSISIHLESDRDTFAPEVEWEVSGTANVSMRINGEEWVCENHDWSVTVTARTGSDARDLINEDGVGDSVATRSGLARRDLSIDDWSIDEVESV